MNSCHHEFLTYEKIATAGNIILVNDDFQVGHVVAGVWLGFNATDNFL